MKNDLENVKVCKCLKNIIQKEFDYGNSIRSVNETPKWPEKDSKFVFLNKKISTKSLVNIHEWVSVRINYDMHYTWYNEIYCRKHHDLLAAGDM